MILCGHTRGHGELPLALQNDLAIVVHCWQHALLKEEDAVLVQSKVAMLCKEILCGFHRSATGHDVPEGHTELSTNLYVLHSASLKTLHGGRITRLGISYKSMFCTMKCCREHI